MDLPETNTEQQTTRHERQLDITTTTTEERLSALFIQRKREELITHLNNQGEILSDSHEFTRLILSACAKLGISDSFTTFAVDTEDEALAFCDPHAQAIALGKGVFSLLQKNGLQIKEDHIAAVIAHELIHSKRHLKNADKKKTNRDRYVSSLQYGLAGHSQENEADREAMNLLAESGYNPTAILDVIKHFTNLKQAGDSTSHPSDYNRLTHLQDILFDDQHPLGKTDKPLTNISESLQEWFRQPSDEMYATTELIVRRNSQELRNDLLGAATLEEFMMLLKGYKKMLQVEKANAIAESSLLNEQMRQSLVINMITNHTIAWEGELIDNPLRTAKYDQRWYRYNASLRNKGLIIEEDNSLGDKPSFMAVKQFTDHHKADTEWLAQNTDTISATLSQADQEMQIIFDQIKNASAEYFEKLEDYDLDMIKQLEDTLHVPFEPDNMSPFIKAAEVAYETEEDIDTKESLRLLAYDLRARQIAVHLEKIFTGSADIDINLIATSFPYRDKDLQQKNINKQIEQAKIDHQPLPSQSYIDTYLSKLYDLESLYPVFFKGLVESAARKIAPEVAVEPELLKAFTHLLHQKYPNIADTNLAVADLLLNNSENKDAQLANLSDEELETIMEIYTSLSETSTGRISPVRDSHYTYRETLIDSEQIARNFYNESKIMSKHELTPGLEKHIVNNYLKRRFTGDQADLPSLLSIQTIENFTISLEEWSTLVRLDASLTPFYKARAIKDLVLAYSTYAEPSDVVLTAVGDVTVLDLSPGNRGFDVEGMPIDKIQLSPDEVQLLLMNAPWGAEITQKYLFAAVDNYVSKMETARSKEERDKIQTTIQQYLEFTDKNQITLDSSPHTPDYLKVNTRYIAALQQLRNKTMNAIIKNELKHYKSTLEQSNAAAINSITQCCNNAIIRNFSDIHSGTSIKFELHDSLFTPNSAAALRYLLSGSVDQLNGLDAQIISAHISHEDFTVNEALRLLSLFPPVPENELKSLTDVDSKSISLPERAAVFLGLSRAETHPLLARKIVEAHGDSCLEWIKKSIHPSAARDRLMASIASLEPRLYEVWSETISKPDIKHEVSHPAFTYARDTARFNLDGYGDEFKNHNLVSTTKEEYEDLTTRRHPFRTLAYHASDLDFNETNNIRSVMPTDRSTAKHGSIDLYEQRGNIAQRIIADRLYAVQDQLTDSATDYFQRELLLLATCPVPTVVRDIHLERMIRAELANNSSSNAEKISRCDKLLSYFASTEFTGHYAGEIIKLKLQTDPKLIQEADSAVDFICNYLPSASLKRNYYLSLIEEKCRINIAQADRIKSLRLTEELESAEGEGYYHMSMVNLVSSELDRTQNRKAVLWLLQMYKDKSEAILEKEEKYKGKFDSVQKIFFGLTPDEREVILKKFLVGEQGLIDQPPSEVYSQEDSERERGIFFERLSEELIPDTTKNHPLLRKLFVTVLSEAQPVRSAQMVTNLLNKFVDAKSAGKTFSPAETLSTSLCSLGIVGKKVAQSLSELSWVPDDYRTSLIEAQENADTVPKHGLMELARQNGLLNDTSPVQIIAIDQLLGAASNKQSALVETKINDPEIAKTLGAAPGSIVELVGKFKRPSAQKTENISHDIKILSKVMEVLRAEGYGDSLPAGFAGQIEKIIHKELQFHSEVDFNKQLSKDLATHGTYKDYSISVPTIAYATDDIILETRAKGISLRKALDTKSIPEPELKTIRTVILRELLFQLQNTGNIHGDLHPANIFVDEKEKTLTLIDLGLNVSFDESKRTAIRRLLQSVATGNNELAVRAFQELGWQIDIEDLQFKPPQLASIVKERATTLIKTNILRKANNEPSQTQSYSDIIAHNLQLLVHLARTQNPPDDIATLIFASSKLEPYIQGVQTQDFLTILSQLAVRNVQDRIQKRLHS